IVERREIPVGGAGLQQRVVRVPRPGSAAGRDRLPATRGRPRGFGVGLHRSFLSLAPVPSQGALGRPWCRIVRQFRKCPQANKGRRRPWTAPGGFLLSMVRRAAALRQTTTSCYLL